ncbi:SpoIIE family protein phosphatase [Modestobacter sp. SYSU DS0875]
MSAPSVPGRCVLVDGTPQDLARLGGVPGLEQVSAVDLAEALGPAEAPVDLVVLGTQATAAVLLAQRAHRLAPGAGIAVLAVDPVAVRRQAAFAPEVPLDLLVAGVDDPDLPARVRELRTASRERRRHAGVLAAITRHPGSPDWAGAPGVTAVGALLEHVPIPVLVAEPTGELLGWNRQAEDLLGLGPAVLGWPVDEVAPGAQAAFSGAGGQQGPAHIGIAGRVLELSSATTQTDTGRPVVLVFATDVTAQRAAERDRDRLAGHVQLLARVSESLMGPLDLTEPLTRLAQALVPGLADWISIQVLDGHGQLHNVAMRHRDPVLAPVARAAEELKEARHCFTEPSRRAAAGERVLLPRIDPGELAGQVADPELRALVTQLGMGSAVAVPITGRERLLGSILLVVAPGGNQLGAPELELAEEIGRRAGVALDNALLYAGQRHLATELQRSLLTAPPETSFADIAVRYLAAAQQAQVGGDWYDAFRRRNGDLLVVVGDVAGHDTRAAAAMGQLRGLVRGIGHAGADSPGSVLTAVDQAIEGLELATIATAVVAQLVAPERDGAAGLQVQWSNAGHPPPVLLEPSGRARLLTPGGGRADLLLGVDAGAPRSSERTTLPAGATLLLYTDGLVERRGESLDEGTDRLLATVEECAEADLDRFCDRVLTRMVPEPGADDVALLAVRPTVRGGSPEA